MNAGVRDGAVAQPVMLESTWKAAPVSVTLPLTVASGVTSYYMSKVTNGVYVTLV